MKEICLGSWVWCLKRKGETGKPNNLKPMDIHGLECLVSQEFPMKIAHGTSKSKVKQTMAPRPQEPVEDIENTWIPQEMNGKNMKESINYMHSISFQIIPYHSISCHSPKPLPWFPCRFNTVVLISGYIYLCCPTSKSGRSAWRFLSEKSRELPLTNLGFLGVHKQKKGVFAWL